MESIRIAPTPAVRRWSAAHGFSPELVARWGAFYPDLAALLSALQAPPSTYLRLNPLRGDPDDTRRRLEAKGFRLESSGIPFTFRVLEQPFSIGATEEYLVGRYILQDVSSALATLALEPRAGERIADLCAAPGGKTIAIAGLTRDAAALFAWEADGERVRSLTSNLHRCGVRSAAVYAARGQEAMRLGVSFDRVLLDAPCTGEGVIPRDASRRQGQLQEYDACAREQRDLLAAAAQVLRPGGTLVYSTCTLAPEENELQVEAALHELPLELEPLPEAVHATRLGGHAPVPGLTRILDRELDARLRLTAHVLPHPHRCLGFYLARFKKVAA